MVIRTLIYNKTKQLLSFHVGGAITIQSSAEEEYEETLTKAASLLKHVKMIDYQNTLLAFLQENEIAGSEPLMGISGGVDSMSLLHLFQTCGLKVTAAHVNYQLRKEESDLDEKLVLDYCHVNNIELFTKRVEINKNVQVEAREIRYTFFHQLANQKIRNYIVTAHHQNDDHETFLLHLIRGSGMKGLKGIPKKDPLSLDLECALAKKQLLDYAKLNQVPYREDQSNHEVKYDRNF